MKFWTVSRLATTIGRQEVRHRSPAHDAVLVGFCIHDLSLFFVSLEFSTDPEGRGPISEVDRMRSKLHSGSPQMIPWPPGIVSWSAELDSVAKTKSPKNPRQNA